MNVTIAGNLVQDPELRFTPSGAQVANFTVAVNKRVFDKQANEWRDGDPQFVRCAIWRQPAENAAESLQKGQRVLVTGDLASRTYEDREGQQRMTWELTVDEMGPSLRFATAKPVKVGGSGGGQQQRRQAQSADPWAAQASDESPF